MTGLKSTSFGIGKILTFSLKRYKLRRALKDHDSWDEVEKIIAAKSGLFGFVYSTKKLEEEALNEETNEIWGDHPEQLFSPKNPVNYQTWTQIR